MKNVMTLSSLFKGNRVFFIGFLIFFTISVFVLLAFSKIEGFYLLNPPHTDLLNLLFIYFTYLGDGFFCVIIGVLLFIFKDRTTGLMIIAGYALSGIIAQVLKYFIVEPRPAILLKDSNYAYFIENVTLHNLHSFPSGHTASAFALAAVLSFAAKNDIYSILFLCGAILVGYSRIYLAQHFLNDVLAGAVIGVVSVIICQVFLTGPFQKIKFPTRN